MSEHIESFLRSMGEADMAAEVANMRNRLDAFSDGLDRECIAVAVAAEREACAKLVEKKCAKDWVDVDKMASAIRARVEK